MMIYPRSFNLRLLRRVKPGAIGTLDLPGASAVWLAADLDAFGPMLDAQNAGAKGGAGAGAGIHRLAEAGEIRPLACGTRVVVRDVRPLSIEVQVTHGEECGRVGWIQRDFFRPTSSACVPCGSRGSSSS
jgi:hypothetical protein